jgi:hypothetical protein
MSMHQKIMYNNSTLKILSFSRNQDNIEVCYRGDPICKLQLKIRMQRVLQKSKYLALKETTVLNSVIGLLGDYSPNHSTTNIASLYLATVKLLVEHSSPEHAL